MIIITPYSGKFLRGANVRGFWGQSYNRENLNRRIHSGITSFIKTCRVDLMGVISLI